MQKNYIDFPMISNDDRLTPTIDLQTTNMVETWYAVHMYNDLRSAAKNLQWREGTPKAECIPS